jgi:hypothetical protein
MPGRVRARGEVRHPARWLRVDAPGEFGRRSG